MPDTRELMAPSAWVLLMPASLATRSIRSALFMVLSSVSWICWPGSYLVWMGYTMAQVGRQGVFWNQILPRSPGCSASRATIPRLQGRGDDRQDCGFCYGWKFQ